MNRSLYILLTLFLLVPNVVSAEAQASERSRRYNVQIGINRAGVSGVCILQERAEEVLGAIINEFGISVLSFRYDAKRRSVKIIDAIPQLDKCYIKRVLKKDLKEIVPQLTGEDNPIGCRYCNERHKIEYTFALQAQI